MAGCASSGNDCYLGNMLHSLEYLPRWYQIIALFGVFLLFPLRKNFVVDWFAASLHYSFGTERVWSDGYQQLLEQMSFDERLCFALYGVALSTLVLLAHSAFSRETLQILAQETGLSGGRRWWLAATVCVVFGCEGIVILKEQVARTLSQSKSNSRLALDGFPDMKKTGFDLRLARGNSHFIIQLEILKALLSSFLKHVGPAAILACVYRLLRDVPRKAHAALRWYFLTFMLSRSLITLGVMYREDDWGRESAWILFASSLSFLGMVNYAFGPSKRGGWTAATSVIASIKKTIKGIMICTAIFFVAHLSVLALVVSVHVVELLLIWLIFFLATVWIPAIIDSCSTDHILCIVATISFVAHKRDYLTDSGAIRLWVLLCIWWIDLCLLYNVVTNACRSRYGGIVALSLLTLGMWHTSGQGRVSNIVSFFENETMVIRDVVEGTWSVGGRAFWGYNMTATPFAALFQLGVVVGGALLACTTLLSVCEDQDVRAHLLRQRIVIMTPGVFFRKIVKSFILGTCLIIFMVAGLVMYRLVPQLAMFVPDFIAFGMALGMACTILGSLMDVQEFLYVGFMRLIGVMEPPAWNDEDKETDPAPFGFEGAMQR